MYMLYVPSRMDKDIYIKEELEAAGEEQDTKGATKWPLETQFPEVQEASSSWIGEDGNVPLTSQPGWSWKREIHDIEDDVNEEIEQKFVCGFPSNVVETSSYVQQEFIPEGGKPFIIDGIYDGYTTLHQTCTGQSYLSEHLTELQPLVVHDIPLARNSFQEENSSLTNERSGEKKARIQRCPVCREVIKSAVDMKNHSMDHAEVWPYTCFVCIRVFTRRFGFHQHMLTKHGVDQPYACNVCKVTFKEIQELNKHNSSHSGKWPFFCNICKKAFTRNYGYRQHMKLHGVLRPHKCSTCQETFSRRLDLDRHMSLHDPEDDTFCCDICGRAFNVRSRLVRHLVTHTEDRPHSCTLCDKSFKCKATLLLHIAWHAGERRYVCTECGKAFRFTFNLKRHMLLHLQDRRNVCTVCGKSFKRGFYFRKHKLKHEKDPSTT